MFALLLGSMQGFRVRGGGNFSTPTVSVLPGAVVGRLGHVAFGGEPLAVLATLVPSASPVSVMTLFPGLFFWFLGVLVYLVLVSSSLLVSRQGFRNHRFTLALCDNRLG